MPPEAEIACGREAPKEGRRRLTLDLGDRKTWATLDLGALTRRLLSSLPDRAQDLIEIAGWIYAADAAIPRGGLTDENLGAAWRRRLRFRMPVRDAAFWSRSDAGKALADVVAILSEDYCEFRFEPSTPGPIAQGHLSNFIPEDLAPDGVILFSGGLDSLAGAMEEAISRRSRVVLVSHRSATKVQRVQDDLVRELAAKVGESRVLHAPIGLNLQQGATRESTHRTRSLFFAAGAAAIAAEVDVDRVRFFENGIVSLNLPPSGQVIGTRATRSTHPAALAALSRLMSLVFDRRMRVENPFGWKTKTEVVSLIRDLGGADLIRATRSCADVRNMTRAHSHCGVCSQCTDRRFAMLAAGLGDDDPVEAYEVDPLRGPRVTGPDREIGLGFVRNARLWTKAEAGSFFQRFGEAQRALDHLDEPPDAAAKRIHDLHRRHGLAVAPVIDGLVAEAIRDSGAFDPASLVRLAGLDAFGDAAAAPVALEVGAPRNDELRVTLRFMDECREVAVEGLGVLKGKSAAALVHLGTMHLEAKGKGLALEDHPTALPIDLAQTWGISEEGVRRRIMQVRKKLAAMSVAKGRDPLPDHAVIENIPSHGYRLNPDVVRVIRPAAAVSPRRSAADRRPSRPPASSPE